MKVAIVDYGTGNLRSIENALDFIGVRHRRVRTPGELLGERRLILPGVGSFRSAMENLTDLGVAEAVREAVGSGAHLLGICLGMQLLAELGEEGGRCRGLGLVEGVVRPLSAAAGVRIPHMGFNEVRILQDHPILSGIPDGSHFYFAHSFRFSDNPAAVIGEVNHGGPCTAVIVKGTVMGAQFHPEKSQSHGLRFLRNFCELSPC